MKKIIVFLVFIVFVFGVYYVKQSNDQEHTVFEFRDDFDSLDDSFWYVGEWQTLFSAYEKAKLNNGIIKLEVDDVDEGPILISKPIKVEDDQVLSVRRRVRINYSDELFTGGFALVETSDKGVIPSALNNDSLFLGNGLVLIEYTHGHNPTGMRPGENVFRVLPRTWMIEQKYDWTPGFFNEWFVGNYQLIKPEFGNWIEEELIFDNTNGLVTYLINGEPYKVWTEQLKSNRVRLYMHSYGFGTGHSFEMDWIEISVE